MSDCSSCAAMREALEAVCETYLMGHDTEACEVFAEYEECEDCELVPKVNAALSSSAGRDFEARIRADECQRLRAELNECKTENDVQVWNEAVGACIAKLEGARWHDVRSELLKLKREVSK